MQRKSLFANKYPSNFARAQNYRQHIYMKRDNIQCNGIILDNLIKHKSASFTLVQEDFVYLNYIGWTENNTVTGQPFETPRAKKLCSS